MFSFPFQNICILLVFEDVKPYITVGSNCHANKKAHSILWSLATIFGWLSLIVLFLCIVKFLKIVTGSMIVLSIILDLRKTTIEIYYELEFLNNEKLNR